MRLPLPLIIAGDSLTKNTAQLRSLCCVFLGQDNLANKQGSGYSTGSGLLEKNVQKLDNNFVVFFA